MVMRCCDSSSASSQVQRESANTGTFVEDAVEWRRVRSLFDDEPLNDLSADAMVYTCADGFVIRIEQRPRMAARVDGSGVEGSGIVGDGLRGLETLGSPTVSVQVFRCVVVCVWDVVTCRACVCGAHAGGTGGQQCHRGHSVGQHHCRGQVLGG